MEFYEQIICSDNAMRAQTPPCRKTAAISWGTHVWNAKKKLIGLKYHSETVWSENLQLLQFFSLIPKHPGHRLWNVFKYWQGQLQQTYAAIECSRHLLINIRPCMNHNWLHDRNPCYQRSTARQTLRAVYQVQLGCEQLDWDETTDPSHTYQTSLCILISWGSWKTKEVSKKT